MNDQIRLKLENLDIQLDNFHLKNIDLQIQQGEYFVLLGPTGAGKTVLMEVIAGIQTAQEGSLYLDGKDITSSPPEQRRVGFVYQDSALFPHLTVAENIGFGLANNLAPNYGINRDQNPGLIRYQLPRQRAERKVAIRTKVTEISTLLKVDHLLQRQTKSLSGGEQQRVALARALIIEPKILLLDEPLSALDPETSEKLQKELARIHNKLGTTTLHITHNFEEAVTLADRIGVMLGGQIIQVGTPRDIFRHPNSEQVARFIGVRNIFRGNLHVGEDGRGVFSLNGFTFDTLSNQHGIVRASIRPEDIILSRNSLESSARNNFKGTITEIADRRSFAYVIVQIPSKSKDGKNLELTVMITHSSAEQMDLSPGMSVHIAFKATALHIF